MNSKNLDLNSIGCNVAAAAKIFDNYGDFIRKVIHSQVHDQDRAEDMFQNFFLSLVSNPLSGDIQNTEAYLYKAITNRIADAARMTSRYQNCIHKYAEYYNNPQKRKTPEQAALDMEEINRAFKLIEKRLPRTEAQAVYLQYRYEFSAKKIAEEMGVKSATVRGYVCEGLRRIRGLLRDISA